MALAEGAVRAGAAGSSGSNRSSSMPMSSLLLAAEAAEFVDDPGGEFRPEIGGDEVGFELVPVDFGFVRELVEEGFEKACHGVEELLAGGLAAGKRGAVPRDGCAAASFCS